MSNVFDFLKKKISGFINKITGKEEQPKVEEKKEATEQEVVSKKQEEVSTEPEIKKVVVPPVEKEEITIIDEKKTELKKEEPIKHEEVKHKIEVKKEVGKPEAKKIEHKKPEQHKKEVKSEIKQELGKKVQIKPEPVPSVEPKVEKKIETKPEIKIEKKKPEITEKVEQKKPVEEKIPPKIEEKHAKEESPLPPIAKSEEEKPKEKEREVKVGILSHLKSIFTGEVEIGKNDVREMLDSLELELIESDVAMEVAEAIKQELEEKLVGKKIKKSDLNNFIKNAIKESLLNIISSDKIFDVVDIIRTYQKPVKILFLGTNGSGKTTTIAKIATMLMQNGNKVVLAAADTFRAAAIEQLATHADRLGVKIIKREYGSDPTAVAYDAISYANAHGIDVVLIDTAGRQETNYNLLNEMKKMQRVIQPNLKIYIGESIAGNAIISQVSEFNKGIGVDAVILTKLDCDAKGGTVLSISKVTGIPIIYLGTGQKYGDLEKFDAHTVVERILS